MSERWQRNPLRWGARLGPVHFQQVRQNENVCFDSPSRLYAVRRSEFEEAEIDRAGVQTYFKSSPRLLRSGEEFVPHPYVPASDPGASVTDVVRLTSAAPSASRRRTSSMRTLTRQPSSLRIGARADGRRPHAASRCRLSPSCSTTSGRSFSPSWGSSRSRPYCHPSGSSSGARAAHARPPRAAGPRERRGRLCGNASIASGSRRHRPSSSSIATRTSRSPVFMIGLQEKGSRWFLRIEEDPETPTGGRRTETP